MHSLVFALLLSPQAEAKVPEPAVAAPDAGRKQARAYLEAQRKQHGFAGASLAWSGADGAVHSLCVGLADVEAKRSLRPSDRLLSGSVGKTYVAALALLLVQDKRSELDTRLADKLGERDWFGRLPNAAELSLRNLLRHQSGIPRYVFSKRFLSVMRADPDKVWKRPEQLALVAGAAPLFAAGKGWGYADTNYLVVGEYLRLLGAAGIEAQLQARILKRFGLRDTVFSNRRAVPGLVPGYTGMGKLFGTPEKTVAKGRYAINPQFEGCGGGFASTAADLCRWGHIWARATFLPKELRAARDAVVPAKGLGPGAGYGLGIMRRRSALGAAWGHSGFMPGYRAEMYYFPKRELCLALMFNDDRRERLGKPPTQHLDALAALLSDAPAGKRGR